MFGLWGGDGDGDDFVVLDPFMGSGTTALAAIANNVAWVGIDISSAYIAMAEERISDWTESEPKKALR